MLLCPKLAATCTGRTFAANVAIRDAAPGRADICTPTGARGRPAESPAHRRVTHTPREEARCHRAQGTQPYAPLTRHADAPGLSRREQRLTAPFVIQRHQALSSAEQAPHFCDRGAMPNCTSDAWP